MAISIAKYMTPSSYGIDKILEILKMKKDGLDVQNIFKTLVQKKTVETIYFSQDKVTKLDRARKFLPEELNSILEKILPAEIAQKLNVKLTESKKRRLSISGANKIIEDGDIHLEKEDKKRISDEMEKALIDKLSVAEITKFFKRRGLEIFDEASESAEENKN